MDLTYRCWPWLMAVATSAHLAAQTASFSRSSLINVPGIQFQEPFAVLSADLDGDGVADLAVTNRSSSNVAVLRGRGDGTFGSARYFRVSDGPIAIIAADLNGDGKLDLATANVGGNSVSLLRGNGDGTFQTAVNIAVEERPVSLAAGDLNADSSVDLIVSHDTCAELFILLGNGDLSFQPARLLRAGGGEFANVQIVLSDVNGDKRLDLLAGHEGSNSISVWLGNGDGSFQSEQTFQAGPDAGALVVADFNRDSKPDVAATSKEGNEVWVLLGNGDGSFQPPLTLKAEKSRRFAIAAGDWNGDGNPDLAVPNWDSHTLTVFLGRGDGSFREPRSMPVGDSPTSVASADFDGDQLPDLAIANLGSHNVCLIPGRTDGELAVRRTLGGFWPTAIVAADFNADGLPDLAAASSGNDTLYLLPGSAAGGLGPVQQYPLGRFPFCAVAADFNQDGLPDLAVSNVDSQSLTVLSGRWEGGLEASSVVALRGAAMELSSGDLNRDGWPDLIGTLPKVEALAVLLGGPNGFEEPRYLEVGFYPGALTVAEFTGDGLADLALADLGQPPRLLLLAGKGDGSFEAPVEVHSGNEFSSLTAADLNGDGKPELVAEVWQKSVFVFMNPGEGRFGPPAVYETGTGPTPGIILSPIEPIGGVVVADFSADGRPDLAVCGVAAKSVLFGTGDGGFEPARPFDTLPGTFCAAAADFNQDGRADLVVNTSRAVWILWNEPGLSPPRAITPPGNAAIRQNDPASGCPPDPVNGAGYRIRFEWSGPLPGEQVVGYELWVGRRGITSPALNKQLPAQTSESWQVCQNWVREDSLEGWEWRVRARDARGNFSDWSVTATFRFEPCRFADGRACGVAPPLVAPRAIWPAGNTAIRQNDPASGCASDAVSGAGYRIRFEWSGPLPGEQVVGYELWVGRRGITSPMLNRQLPSQTSEFWQVCQNWVREDSLEGWEWRVRARDARGNFSDWSVTATFRFEPCRFADGRACGTPPPPAPGGGAFVVTGSLNVPRAGHTATLLGNSRVLIVGGHNYASGDMKELATAELWDPQTQRFTFTGPLRTGRTGHRATLLADGRVLITGGKVFTAPPPAEPLALSTAEIYDPSTGQFTPAASMTQARADHGAVRLADGRVLITAGSSGLRYLYTAELFDPATRTFTSTGSMQLVRGANHTATLLPSGKVLIVEGYGPGVGVPAELYDPAKGVFTMAARPNTGRQGQLTATLLPNGQVLIAGGVGTGGGVAQVEVYDPVRNVFIPAGVLATARWAHEAALLRDGSVLITGGWTWGAQPVDTTERIIPASGLVVPAPAMQSVHANHTATLLPDGRVLVTGGGRYGTGAGVWATNCAELFVPGP